jgi:hypothetical protein
MKHSEETIKAAEEFAKESIHEKSNLRPLVQEIFLHGCDHMQPVVDELVDFLIELRNDRESFSDIGEYNRLKVDKLIQKHKR